MAEFPAMPVFTDALAADCGHLSDAEFGLYMRLLFLMWRSSANDGTLPNDDAWLARRLGRTVEEVQTNLRPIIKEFCQVRGSRLTQKRLQRELVHCHEYRKRQSERAKLRWDKEKRSSRRNAEPAMHPIPISKTTTTEYEAMPAEPEKPEPVAVSEGRRDESRTNGSALPQTITVSPALLNTRLMRH